MFCRCGKRVYCEMTCRWGCGILLSSFFSDIVFKEKIAEN